MVRVHKQSRRRFEAVAPAAGFPLMRKRGEGRCGVVSMETDHELKMMRVTRLLLTVLPLCLKQTC